MGVFCRAAFRRTAFLFLLIVAGASASLVWTAPLAEASRATQITGGSRMRKPSITITSSVFQAQARIPASYTGDGKDVSPPLGWTGVPPETKELALICDDPDAPSPEPWVHWVLYGLAPSMTGLPEGLPAQPELKQPVHALQGINSFGNTGYGGPLPPPGRGPHRYFFRIYALARKLSLPPGLTANELRAALSGQILAEGSLVGTYERPAK